MEADGWTIHHKGWPDFLCVKGGEVQFIEIKNPAQSNPGRHQRPVLSILRALGLTVRLVKPRGWNELDRPWRDEHDE